MHDEDPSSVNERELMEYYGYEGSMGNFAMKMKFLRSWILHSMAYSCPESGLTAKIQRLRGVKIGDNCHFSPYVQLDLNLSAIGQHREQCHVWLKRDGFRSQQSGCQPVFEKR